MFCELMNKRISHKLGLFQGDGLKGKFLRGSFVMTLGVVISKVFGFGSKVILTRLLLPQEIGLVVMIIAITGLFDVLAEVGVKQSVIQNPRGDEWVYLNTAWWFQAVRSSGLFGMAYVVSPLVCSFYFKEKGEVIESHTMQEIIMISRVSFLTILFNGLVSPRAHVLEKHLSFGKVVILNQLSFLLGAIVTIFLAVIYRSVWAMVVGLVIAAMTKCVLSYVLCPFLPRFAYDRESFGEVLVFARGVFGLPLLTHAIFNMDLFFLGKMLPASTVGMYGMALLLARTPKDIFGKIFAPLLLPAFARLQADTQRLRMVVVKAIWVTIGASFPMCIAAVFFRKQILALVFGAEYVAVGTAFGLSSIYAVCLMVSGILASALYGIGRPEKHRLGLIIWAVISAILICPFVKLFGIAGAPGSLMVGVICSLLFEWKVVDNCLNQKRFLALEESRRVSDLCGESKVG